MRSFGFATCERGSIAVVAAATSMLLVLGAGIAVDSARWFSARRATAAAVDAAVLAGARSLQINPGNTEAALAVAQKIYASNKSEVLATDAITFSVASDGLSVQANGDASVATTFLQVAGIPELSVAGYSDAAIARAAVSVGGAGGSNIEVSIMLDVTGSMCDDGAGPCSSASKLSGLKEAAKKLIDIVVADEQGALTSKVALVPFSTRVRVAPDGQGGQIMNALTGLPPTWSGWYETCTAGNGTGGSETAGDWTCTGGYKSELQTNWPIMPCVTDRFYDTDWVFDASDTAPGNGTWLNAHDGRRMPSSQDSSDKAAKTALGKRKSDPATHWNYGLEGCYDVAPANEIMPLSSDKAALKKRIDGLEAYGSTAGALGTSWAWYMLSPKWAMVFPSGSGARPYSELNSKGRNGAPLLRKVAILMTDGGYNTYRSWKGSDQQTVSNYAVEVCSNMKAAGVEVFTVAFALNQLPATERQIAEATLKACGSDVSHFYDTLDVQQLYSAFQDIALKLTSVRLTE
jgi:Flp pilus assembly protein TadG